MCICEYKSVETQNDNIMFVNKSDNSNKLKSNTAKLSKIVIFLSQFLFFLFTIILNIFTWTLCLSNNEKPEHWILV